MTERLLSLPGCGQLLGTAQVLNVLLDGTLASTSQGMRSPGVCKLLPPTELIILGFVFFMMPMATAFFWFGE